MNTTFEEPKYLLNIKLCSENDILIQHYSDFIYHHSGDSGIDLYTPEILNVEPLEVGTIDFKIQCEMINLENNTFTSYYLVPRSSISNTPFQLANSIGIIDAGYRGNLKAKVRNMSFKDNELSTGKHFQIIAPDMKPIKTNIVAILSDTTRGSGGFGSTK